jgi:kumamolisin
MSTSTQPPVGLAALEAAYKTLGQLISVFEGQPGPAAPGQALPNGRHAQRPVAARKLRCRNYIKYPTPQGLRPRALTPFRVADLCTAYNFPTGLAGGGVIGILELGGGYTQPDLDMFSQLNGLPQIIPEDISVGGGQNSPGGEADGEVLLDIQVAAAAYFFCTGQLPKIKMLFAPNADASFVAGMNAAMTAGCDVLSISWGKDEADWDPQVASEVEAAAQAATENGCVVFAAAGDNSSGDGAPGANVDMPSSCPHIVGCGGTRKTAFSEVVWGDGTPNGRGTGGGYSALFPPQDFQVGAPPSPGQPGRMVPDLAADADPNTGYLVVVNGHEVQIGGTSAVAPLYSGLFAAFGRKLGFATPTLWQNPEAFLDITQGSNGSFNAAVGPDPCTGLGAPIGTALANLFAAAAGGMPHARRRHRAPVEARS